MHKVMSVAFVVMGIAFYGIDATENLFVIEVMFLLVETADIIINICSTVCIVRLHSSKGEPWIKSRHLSYGMGAFVSPLLISVFGIRSYTIYGFLAIPFVMFLLLNK
jgi:hypothetical protein